MSDRPDPPSPDDDAFLQSLADGLSRVAEAARARPAPVSGAAGGDDVRLKTERPAPRPPSAGEASLPERAAETIRRAAAAAAATAPTTTAAAPKPTPATPPPAAAPAPGFAPASAPAARSAPSRALPTFLRSATVGALLAACVAGAWFALSSRAPTAVPIAASIETLPPTGAGPARGAPQQASAQPPATVRFQMISDPDASTEVRMLDELTRAVVPDGVALTPEPAASTPRLGILRYDAMRSAPGEWRLVAPLHVETVYALVRSDSPLRFLHELRGKRIDVGPSGGARALSGSALYRRLFGGGLPSAPAATLAPAAALQALLQGDGLDAVLLFDGQPSRWVQDLPAATRARLRLLELAPDNPASRRALQTYLSASVSPLGADGAPASVPTLGVVAFLAAPAQTPGLGRLVRAMCERLPALRRSGDPAWREVQPALQLPGGSPPTYEVSAALQSCAVAPAAGIPSTPAPGA